MRGFESRHGYKHLLSLAALPSRSVGKRDVFAQVVLACLCIWTPSESQSVYDLRLMSKVFW
jgi:hypothetical protein